jgi:hypothetical protein
MCDILIKPSQLYRGDVIMVKQWKEFPSSLYGGRVLLRLKDLRLSLSFSTTHTPPLFIFLWVSL